MHGKWRLLRHLAQRPCPQSGTVRLRRKTLPNPRPRNHPLALSAHVDIQPHVKAGGIRPYPPPADGTYLLPQAHSVVEPREFPIERAEWQMSCLSRDFQHEAV